MVETLNTDMIMGNERGLNMFSLYSLSFIPSMMDSAIDMSELRAQTSHIANIWSSDEEVSYEGLQRAMSNLSRMYSDTLSMSLRSGSATPCLLPLTANLSDFPVNDTCSSLSSFQTSLADSLQSSLIETPANLLRTSSDNLDANLVKIIPRPLFRDPLPSASAAASASFSPQTPSSSSTPTIIPAQSHIPCSLSPTAPPFFPKQNFSLTVNMPTAIIRDPTLDSLLQADTMEIGSNPPTMTEADLQFYHEAKPEVPRPVAVIKPEVVSQPDEDVHLLMSTDEPDSYTSYEEFAYRFRSYLNYDEDHDVEDDYLDDEEDAYFHK